MSVVPRPGPCVVLGAALLVAVIGWRLAHASLRADVVTLCDAERLSGLSVRWEMADLSEWTREHLSTREGQLLFEAMRDAPPAERGARLEREARRLRASDTCPMATTYRELESEAEYRRDLEALCSYATFEGVLDLPPESIERAMRAWINELAAHPRTRQIGAWLPFEHGAAAKAVLLREAAGEIGLFGCDVARAFERGAVVACRSR